MTSGSTKDGLNIAIIGDGAIGRYVKQAVRARGWNIGTLLVRSSSCDHNSQEQPLRIHNAEDIPQDTTLVIDCAGHSALAEHGPAILNRGVDLLTVSLGALADATLYSKLNDAARQGGARLHLASGAIGALDCLQAARVGGLQRVTYIGRKPPQGWKGSMAETTLDLNSLKEATIHFQGSARQAAIDYPKNANVAAAVALAGEGFDNTDVILMADPTINANIHEIEATGSFGKFTFHIEGHALPDNPRSSALAAMSVLSAIERRTMPITL